MPNLAREELVAKRILAVAVRDMAAPDGVLVRHDAQRSPLQVDFVIEADPGLAIEVTALVDDRHEETVKASRRRHKKLGTHAAGVAPGTWIIGIRSDTQVRSVESDIRSLMQRMKTDNLRELRITSAGILDPTSSPEAKKGSGFDGADASLAERGLVSLKWHPGPKSQVTFLVITETRMPHGFTEALARACAENATKLDAARPRQTHLVVDVQRSHALREPSRTHVPDLARSIDLLWIYHGAHEPSVIWSARRGSHTWTIHVPMADELRA